MHRRFLMAVPLAIALWSGLAPQIATAQSAEARGLEIAKEMDRRDAGFKDMAASLTMVLRNRHGEESTRETRNRTLEGTTDGDKTLIVFDEPRDVQGTALLTFTHKAGDDDQWLYLPALKRVKRIASNNKSGPFMGSEFAYEDVSSQEVEKYTYKYLRDETLGGAAHFVVERVPVDPRSGYNRQIVWIDQKEYRPMKVEFYDRKNELLKTLDYVGYKKYLDKFWRPNQMKMVNHQSGKSTDLNWTGYKFKNGFTERDFDQNSLKLAK
jgi:outer membrane lipoprotein-sorting protein